MPELEQKCVATWHEYMPDWQYMQWDESNFDIAKAPLYVRGAVTGFSAAFFNTLFFMSLLVIFFGSTEKLAGPIAEKGVLMYIITSVGINAVVELIVAAVVTGAAGVALKKARLID